MWLKMLMIKTLRDQLLAMFDDDAKLIKDDYSKTVIDDEIEDTINYGDIIWDVLLNKLGERHGCEIPEKFINVNLYI